MAANSFRYTRMNAAALCFVLLTITQPTMAMRSIINYSQAMNTAKMAVPGERINVGDWSSIVSTMKKVDQESRHDAFVVYETDGKSLAELAQPDPECVSWVAFKNALLQCGPLGKICIGIYKFNYPIIEGGSTLKGKSALVLAQDPEVIQKTLGRGMKSMRVQFSTISDVWKPLEQELKAAQVKPNIKLELGKGKAVKGATTEWIWKQFKRKVSRADYGVSTFIAYTNARNARVASQGCSGGSWAFGEDEPAAPAVPQTPRPATPAPERRRRGWRGPRKSTPSPRPSPKNRRGGLDWSAVVNEMKKIDHNSWGDVFIVYETDGLSMELLAKPEASCVSWNTFKDFLLQCPSHGKICIAMYKFNYPIFEGSSTLKGKTLLIKAQDPEGMRKVINNMKVTRVQMSTISNVWGPLDRQLKDAHIAANLKYEFGSAEQINRADPELMWKNLALKATRVDPEEEPSFLADAYSRIERVASNGCSVGS